MISSLTVAFPSEYTQVCHEAQSGIVYLITVKDSGSGPQFKTGTSSVVIGSNNFGLLKSITVVWGTKSNENIAIYSSATPYVASDCAVSGEEVGTIEFAASEVVTYTFDEPQRYVALTSTAIKGKACQWMEMHFEWEPATLEPETPSEPDPEEPEDPEPEPEYVTDHVVINEVMQSNIDVVYVDNEFPDSWVEIYNPTDEALTLSGWKLGAGISPDEAYALPDIELSAHGHQLIYCDKVGEGLHTHFRVDSGKGAKVYLFDSAGTVVDNVTIAKKMPAPNIAYSRKEDASVEWGYALKTTPGAANAGGVTTDTGVLPSVAFSPVGGVFNLPEATTIELSTAKAAPEGTVIVYTTDGTEPTLENGTVYTEPFEISATTNIRAKAFCDGYLSIPSSVNSYIFLEREQIMPVVSITVDPRYFYDEVVGILADGPDGTGNENWRNDWRRPINIEFFPTGEAAAFNQLCETRVQGGSTRINSLKSMAFYANKRFGEKRFNHVLWPQDKPNVAKTSSFLLRNGGNDFKNTYIRDALHQRIMGRRTAVLDWQGASYAIVFINGEYHAMMEVRERSNEDNIEANYNGLEDIDMVENDVELKAGSFEDFTEMRENIVKNYDCTQEELLSTINFDSYIDLITLNYWIYNYDFPHNNTVIWRDLTPGADSRWRWLMKDTDFGTGCYEAKYADENYHDFMQTGISTLSYIYRQMLRPGKEEMLEKFVDHLVAYMGDFLNAETFNAMVDEMIEEVGQEIIISDSKICGHYSTHFYTTIGYMRNWFPRREAAIPGHMQESFGYGEPVRVTVNHDIDEQKAEGLVVTYADVPLSKSTWNGLDYEGRTIRLSAFYPQRDVDYVVSGWSVARGDEEPEVYNEPDLVLPVDAARGNYAINAIITSNVTSVKDVVDSTNTTIDFSLNGNVLTTVYPVEVYSVSGAFIGVANGRFSLPSRGVYILSVSGKDSAKVVW